MTDKLYTFEAGCRENGEGVTRSTTMHFGEDSKAASLWVEGKIAQGFTMATEKETFSNATPGARLVYLNMRA